MSFEPIGIDHLGPDHRRPTTVQERAIEALIAIQALHVEEPSKLLTRPSTCAECGWTWPCETVRIVERVAL